MEKPSGHAPYTVSSVCGWCLYVAKEVGARYRVSFVIVPGARLYSLSRDSTVYLAKPLRVYLYFGYEKPAVPRHAYLPTYMHLKSVIDRIVLDAFSPPIADFRRERASELFTSENLWNMPTVVLDGGCGGPLKFYRFVIALVDKPMRLTESGEPTYAFGSLYRSIYIGKYVYSAHVNIVANSTSTVKVVVKDYLTNATIYRYIATYDVGRDPIPVTVPIPVEWGHNGYYVDIYVSGNTYMKYATLSFTKVYPQMPIFTTAPAYYVLSAATGEDPGTYVGGLIKLPLSKETSFTFPIPHVNGLYIDYVNKSVPQHIIVRVKLLNTRGTVLDGYIDLYIGEYLTKHIPVKLAPYDKVVVETSVELSWAASYWDYSPSAPLTIKLSDSLKDVEALFDVYVKALYAPEVWAPNSSSWWDPNSPEYTASKFVAKFFAEKPGVVAVASARRIILEDIKYEATISLEAQDEGNDPWYVGTLIDEVVLSIYAPAELGNVTVSEGHVAEGENVLYEYEEHTAIAKTVIQLMLGALSLADPVVAVASLAIGPSIDYVFQVPKPAEK